MRVHRSRAIAAGVLCAVAATVAFWSGPLLSASSAMHTGATATATAAVTAHSSAHPRP